MRENIDTDKYLSLTKENGVSKGAGMDGKLMSPEELAAFLDVPLRTVYNWRYEGIGPRGLKVGRHVRYRREDVDAWLRTRDKAGTAA
jgi:excisionase family DNA binding protein